ncbi:Baseplate J-like protein [Cyclobacterium xiamenense]|uniref:Baseplate J-like protein n=1 Tax=Cyclobacterium xiamenense TaxID=1297121 RepID=A0A1H6U9U7_9BACT|nr:baseplate J/gp47 family protein [Cyclobacterium xiamenense]SEI84995.1 Baseplate J-like protein [Cyclobacterium xiamenense]
MQPENLNILRILWRKGRSREDREQPDLNPDSLDLMALDVEDWIFFAHNFAQFIPFLPVSGSGQPVHTWQVFFSELLDIADVPQKGTRAYEVLKANLRDKLAAFSESGNLAPQLTVLVAFLELLEYSRKRMNGIGKRHLDFYYRSVLNLPNKAAAPDEAFVVVEVAKNQPVHLPIGTAFDGGKDEKGLSRHYRTVTEFSANRAQVVQVKNRFADGRSKQVKVSQVANSLDGTGASFLRSNQGWWPFGHTLADKDWPALPNASFGFGLAAAVLWSSDAADRYLSFEFEFKKNLPFQGTDADVAQLFSCHCTGAKEWISLSPSNHPKQGMVCSVAANRLVVVLYLPKSLGPLTAPQEAIHGPSPGGGDPLIWFDLKCASKKAYDWIKGLSETALQKINLTTRNTSIRQPTLESDLGVINASKPFQPFGSIPRKGSSWYIRYPDWEKKSPSKVTVRGTWSNTPEDFKEWYFGYRNLGNDYLSKDSYLAQHFRTVSAATPPVKTLLWQPSGLKAPLLANQIVVNTDPPNLLVESEAFFSAAVSVGDGQSWTTYLPSETLLEKKSGSFVLESEINSKPGETSMPASGGVKFTLLQSFLHELFPRLYALAMASDQPETPIPNEPYTPLLENLEISFDTQHSFSLSAEESGELSLFHRDDFGYFEDAMERDASAILEEKYLLAFPGVGGELFLGIKDLQKNQQLSLLFQVLEGSENPSNAGSAQESSLQWKVLTGNRWQLLTKEQIVSNQTQNFLRSGILVVSLPEGAFDSHDRMSRDLVWIKVHSSAPFDASSRMLGVYTQAVKTRFENRGNDLAHLKHGLPAESIGKMVERKAGIKSVYQPFNSVGGKAEESDRAFYTRVSERLRHKNRAVSLWDYEQLVLQEFPEVYRVKCLNHSTPDSFLAPGKVLLVVVPDTVNKNVFDVFKPTLSGAQLAAIASFLRLKTAPQVQLEVINPVYEEIKVKVQVRFKPGLDAAHYLNEMEKALIGFLSPWTTGDRQAIDFSSYVNRSGLIYFFEKLDYVDFIQQPVLYKNGVEIKEDLFPKSPLHILVSAKSHDISLYEMS